MYNIGIVKDAEDPSKPLRKRTSQGIALKLKTTRKSNYRTFDKEVVYKFPEILGGTQVSINLGMYQKTDQGIVTSKNYSQGIAVDIKDILGIETVELEFKHTLPEKSKYFNLNFTKSF